MCLVSTYLEELLHNLIVLQGVGTIVNIWSLSDSADHDVVVDQIKLENTDRCHDHSLNVSGYDLGSQMSLQSFLPSATREIISEHSDKLYIFPQYSSSSIFSGKEFWIILCKYQSN